MQVNTESWCIRLLEQLKTEKLHHVTMKTLFPQRLPAAEHTHSIALIFVLGRSSIFMLIFAAQRKSQFSWRKPVNQAGFTPASMK